MGSNPYRHQRLAPRASPGVPVPGGDPGRRPDTVPAEKIARWRDQLFLDLAGQYLQGKPWVPLVYDAELRTGWSRSMCAEYMLLALKQQQQLKGAIVHGQRSDQ